MSKTNECLLKVKAISENFKDASTEAGATSIVRKATDAILKPQDLIEKYPVLKPVYNVLKGAQQIMHDVVSKTTPHFQQFAELSDEKMVKLINVMHVGDKNNIRFSNEELANKFGLDAEQIKAYNGYREAVDTVFYENAVGKIEELGSNKTPEEIAQAKANLDSFIEKTKRTTTKQELLNSIRSDKSLSQADRIQQLGFASGYKHGWMERGRGTGTHAVVVYDNNGKVIYRRNINPMRDTLFTGKDQLHAEAKAVAEKSLAENKAKNVALYESLKSKAEERANRTTNKDRKDKYNALIAKYEQAIVKENARTVGDAKTKSIEENEFARNTMYKAIQAIQNQKQNALQMHLESIEANKTLNAEQKAKAISDAKKLADSVYDPRIAEIKKEADATSFARHKIHRSKEYIAGVKLEPSDVRADLLNYINQGAKAKANSITASKAYAEVLKVGDKYLNRYGHNMIEEFMRSSTDIERKANIVASSNFFLQFAGSIKSGIVNFVGNMPNHVAVLNEHGLSTGEALSNVKYSYSKAGSIIGEYLSGMKNYKDFADFLDKSKAIKSMSQDEQVIIKKAIKDGLMFDIMQKEFGNISAVQGAFGKVQKGLLGFMTMTERINRLASVISAVKMSSNTKVKYGDDFTSKVLDDALNKGNILNEGSYHDKLLNYADYITTKVNAEYGVLGRSKMEMGSGIGAVALRTLFPFQSYTRHQLMGLYPKYVKSSIDYLAENMKRRSGEGTLSAQEFNDARNGARAFVNMNLGLGLVGGASAVPLLAAYDTLQALFSDEPTAIEQAKTKTDLYHKIMSAGVPSLLGIDITGSTNANMPYVGGSYVTSRWNSSDSIEQIGMGNFHKAIADNFATPAFIKAIDSAVFDTDLLSKTGAKQIVNGSELQRDTWEKVAKSLGFQTYNVSSEKQKIYISKQLDKWVADEKKKLNYKFSEGTLEDEELNRFDDRLDAINQLFGKDYSYEPRERTDKEYDIEIED